MNQGERQVIAEKVSSTVRVLELLGFEYEVTAPRNQRKKGNRSPRVVYVNVDIDRQIFVYNSAKGYTWANESDGNPIASVNSIEDLYTYLAVTYRRKPARKTRK